MSTWNIYHKDGSKLTDVNGEQITVHGLEYSDSWMGECFLTISFKHEVPISFQIGDYIVYRGERFELNYEPGKDKQARPDTYGEGFVYDSVKFNALQDELSRAEFLDVVLNDNELHYTALPKFPFYVQTLDDLLDRIQANLDEQIGKGLWKIYSRNMERSVQRGCLASDWLSMYGEGTSDNVIESMSITVDSQTCWQALALVNEKWNINFIVRGRNVYVGTTGIQAKHIFKYGLGNGLYEIVQNADSDQSVITRLRAYGSEKNLPSHYYADLGVKYVANITKVVEASTYVELELDLDYIETYFKNKRKYVVSGESQEQYSGWVLQVTFDFQNIITGYVAQMHGSGKCRFHSELKGAQVDTGDEESKEKLDAFIAQVKAGKTKMYITSGLNKKTVPSSMKEYAENLPNNMSINRLMLPGFPHVSLSDFYESLTDEEKKYVNPTGKQHRFSTDPHRPYIDSINIDQIGLRSASQFFDTDDKTNGIIEIYPTIEEMVVGGVRVDEIDEGIAPDDDGRYNDDPGPKNVDIYLNKAVDFDIKDLADNDFSISMKDGMCGGRTFKVASSTKVDGRWRLTIERIKDDALELWFPYKDYPIRKGDHFVLTGITLPDSYVKAASLKLLKYAIALLEKNDYTRYVYQPKVDEIFMARQHDTAMADETGAIKSLHDTLKAGDLMDFRDDDLNISGTITIDQLNIKEQDGKIPTYEITLREEKEVGTIQKIQQQITSLESGNGGSGGGGGITLTQVKGQVATEGSKVFLSKLTDDTANGKITFIKGLIAKGLADLAMGATFGNSAKITELSEAFFRAIKSLDYDNAAEQGFSVEKEKNGKYHAFFTNLTIWGKAIFHELEIRKLSYSGGNIYLSGAGSKLIKVVPVKQSVSNGVTTWVETTEDDAERVGWKCYLLADNGTTATMNDWQEGDQARCQTMGEIVAGGTYQNASNKSYWRTIPDGGVSTQNEKIYGTKKETYLDEDGNEQTKEVQVELYDGQAFAWIVVGKHCGDIDGYDDEFSVGYNGSNPAPLETRDIPSAGDTIVLDGNRHRNEHGEYDKTDRQNVIILETTGEYAPRIACYANITEYKHTITKSVNGSDKEVSLSVFETSPKGGTKINSSRFEWISEDGSTINIINYRGDWVEETKYHKNDQVNHNNAVWVCVANSGVDVSEEPSDSSKQWKKVLSGGKGEKGDKGDDGLSGNGVVPVYARSKDNPTPPTSTDKNNLDNGWSLAIPSVADVKNVSYSGSSWTDYNDGSYTWKKSPTTAANSTSWCLVTFTTTQANQTVMFVIKSFSEKKYDYIFLSEIDASNVPSKPGFAGASRAVSGNDIELSITDVVATAGTHTVYICYGKDASGDYNGDYGLFRIESMAGIPLWQSNGKEVFTRDDGGTTKSKIESWSEPFKVTGENGTDGKDAYRVVVSPSALIFDTDDNGRVTSFSGKTATIRVFQGDKDVSKQFSKYDRLPSNYYNCNGSLKDLNTSPLEIQVTEIETQVVTDTAGNKSTISKTNGFLEFILTNDSATVTAHVDVQVNVAKFTGQMVNTNKRFSNTLTEVGNRVNDKMDKFDLTEFKSEITQTAREISLSVSEKSIARRNLLVGSAFLREDNNRIISNDARIEINSGYQGTNCIHVIDATEAGHPHYVGAYWDGSQGGRSIKIEKGKKYTMSCFYKTNDINAMFCLEAIYTDKQENATRKGRAKYLSPSEHTVKKVNEWELFTSVVDTTDAKYDYIAFNFLEACNVVAGQIEAWICRPMVEEGDTYGGWTLSQNDYDIIGANLIDNSRTLDVGGNIFTVIGKKTLVGDVCELTASGSDDYNQFYRIKGNAFKLNTDYTLSFEVRGDAEYLEVNAFYPANNTKYTCYIEQQNNVMHETAGDGTTVCYVILGQFKVLSKQQNVWVHFRFKDRLPEQIYFQFKSNADQIGVTSWNVTIARPKIEVGAVVTEYTERKTDLIDKATLKKAGIEITSDQVILYGNKVQVKNPKANPSEGYDEAAMFQNGKLNAQFINAGDIVAEGIKTQELEAQNLNVTGNSRLGIFRVKTSGADERDQYTIAGDMITYSGDYKFPDGTTTITSDDGLAYLMYKPLFIRQGAPDAGKYMRLGNCYTEWDDSGFGFDHSYLFNGASARYVCGGVESECKKYVLPTDLTYNTHYFPVSYIYSIKSSPNDPAFAINVQKAKNTTGERTAIQTNGAIRGVLAPNSMSISWNNTIPNGIGVVICTNDSEMTLTLPANPLEGQTLIIIQGSDKRVYIVPSGDEVIYCGGQTRDKNNKFFSGMIGQFNIFVFIRGNWQLQWMNYRL
jgi:hypothetical protein|uniref:Uncharacterized protein n=1 Tax=Myoviridae sp. ctBoB21 TaxID=2827287 RepID=A0A8S5R6Q3_9CAUD|nr:MAG TPA: hypothetical protein [Myoviridae sp. ctBoB21]